MPNGPKTGANGARPGLTGPNKVKCSQMSQTGLNGAKQGQTGPNGAKLGQTRPNICNLGQVVSNGAKQGDYAWQLQPGGSFVSNV